jgi:hypothetical protein
MFELDVDEPEGPTPQPRWRLGDLGSSLPAQRAPNLQWVPPVLSVLDLDPVAPSGSVEAAAFLGDDAFQADVADGVPERFAVLVARADRPVVASELECLEDVPPSPVWQA